MTDRFDLMRQGSLNRKRVRDYPINSGHAATRIVALALIADKVIQPKELAILDLIDAAGTLGVTKEQWDQVLNHFLVDLTVESDLNDLSVHPILLNRLLGEITNAGLRKTVARLADNVINADQHCDPSELSLVKTIRRRWCLDDSILKPKETQHGRRLSIYTPRASQLEHWLLPS